MSQDSNPNISFACEFNGNFSKDFDFTYLKLVCRYKINKNPHFSTDCIVVDFIRSGYKEPPVHVEKEIWYYLNILFAMFCFVEDDCKSRLSIFGAVGAECYDIRIIPLQRTDITLPKRIFNVFRNDELTEHRQKLLPLYHQAKLENNYYFKFLFLYHILSYPEKHSTESAEKVVNRFNDYHNRIIWLKSEIDYITTVKLRDFKQWCEWRNLIAHFIRLEEGADCLLLANRLQQQQYKALCMIMTELSKIVMQEEYKCKIMEEDIDNLEFNILYYK